MHNLIQQLVTNHVPKSFAATLSENFLIWLQSHPYVCFWSIKNIDPSRLRRRAQPNLIIVYVIIAGLASSFFASSSSFWCFLLSLQGDSCASATTPAQWVHICGTKHVRLSGSGAGKLGSAIVIKCPIHALIMAYQKNTGWWFQPLWKILISWDYYSHMAK